jgi:23S rRNA-/tRNA-specific pseudouridylate synthase
MTNQPDNKTLTPQALRQSLLSMLEASQQAIAALNDEELATVTGGWQDPQQRQQQQQQQRVQYALHEILYGRTNRWQPSAPSSPDPARPINSSPALRRTRSTGSISDAGHQMQRLEEMLGS